MRKAITHRLIKFALQDAELSSHFRTVKLHADAGLKAPHTIAKMLLAKVRMTMSKYRLAFGEPMGGQATERALVERFAAEFRIKLATERRQ